jgi:hypothetical protein
MAYRRRIIDEALDELFPDLAAIALEGAKGVGKTASATQRASTVLSLNNPNEHAALASNLDLVTQVPPPVLIDEWQLEPSVWDRVRRAVDDDSTGGRFLLAGSAGAAPGIRIHSGAGRIVSMAMRPMAFSERGAHDPTVSLRALLDGKSKKISGTSGMDVPAYTDEILRSGFPGIRDLPERARQLQLDSYVARIVERELPENGVSVRRPGALTRRQRLPAQRTAPSSTRRHRAKGTSQHAKPLGHIENTYNGSSSSTRWKRGFPRLPPSSGSPIHPSIIWSTRQSPPGSLASTRPAYSAAKATAPRPRPTRGSARCSSRWSLNRSGSTRTPPRHGSATYAPRTAATRSI